MPLKDLLIDSTKLAEEQIEAMVKGHASYDAKTKTVVFVRGDLDNAAAVLVYLVALRGWGFVLDATDLPAEDATPLQVAKATGMPSGSTKPTLTKLAAAGLVTNRKGRYSVASHNLQAVRAVIDGASVPMRATRKSRKAGVSAAV